jgi:hypothetical protein
VDTARRFNNSRVGARSLNLYADRPDEADQLAGDGRKHLLYRFAASKQTEISTMKSMLSFPCDCFYYFAETSLSLAQSHTDRWPMTITPRRFYQNTSKMGVAASGYPAPPDTFPAGMLASDHSGVTHQKFWSRKT